MGLSQGFISLLGCQFPAICYIKVAAIFALDRNSDSQTLPLA